MLGLAGQAAAAGVDAAAGPTADELLLLLLLVAVSAAGFALVSSAVGFTLSVDKQKSESSFCVFLLSFIHSFPAIGGS